MTRNVMGPSKLLSALALLVAGCSAPPSAPLAEPRAFGASAAPDAPALVVMPLRSAAAPVPPRVELAEAEPRESSPFTIPLPQKLACQLEDSSKSPPSVELGLSRTGPGFGVVRPRSLIARIGVDEHDMVIDAEATGIRLRAIAVGDSLDLYAASPVMFEDLLMPQAYAELGVVAGTSGGIEMSIALPKQVVVPKRKALSARVPCANLLLQQTRFDAVAAVGVAIDEAYLLPDATAISTTPGGKAIAMLHPRGASLQVGVLAHEGRYTQIAWEVEAVVAVGWVDKTRLRKVRVENDEFGAGGLGLSGIGEGSARTLRCDGDVPLRAQVENRTEIIGVVLPGTSIEIEGERPYAYEVELPSSGLDKHEKAVLLVDKEQLGSCRG